MCLLSKLHHHQRHNSLSYLQYILNDYQIINYLILIIILFINDVSINTAQN